MDFTKKYFFKVQILNRSPLVIFFLPKIIIIIAIHL